MDDQKVISLTARATGETIALLRDAAISGQTIFCAPSAEPHLAKASMYEGWKESPTQHFRIAPPSQDLPQTAEADCVIVFDTWGTTSYYHLLIDCILPLWMTREFLIERAPGLDAQSSFIFYRIARNGGQDELSSAPALFEHFLGAPVLDALEGRFDHIAYGFLYGHRPFRGMHYPRRLTPEYRGWLAKFRAQFCRAKMSKEAPILVPVRDHRNYEFVSRFLDEQGGTLPLQPIDLGALSISDQIAACQSARGLFGSEGAAFANQIFLPDGALVAPVSDKAERFRFHSYLAKYCGHDFLPVREGGWLTPLAERRLLRRMEA